MGGSGRSGGGGFGLDARARLHRLDGLAGFGAVPKKWNWSNVPREVLGEGIVVRTAPNSASMLVTYSLREILAGDYVELE